MMVKYYFKNADILFIGINPHFGSFNRGVPFSNNKLFWYLLAEAGIIAEKREDLKNDEYLKNLYHKKFADTYKLGLVNMVDRPSRDITDLKKGEEDSGRKRLEKIINIYHPKIVCFVGKITYQKFTGIQKIDYGWKDDIADSKIFVMHTPLRGEAIVRIRELRIIKNELKKLKNIKITKLNL